VSRPGRERSRKVRRQPPTPRNAGERAWPPRAAERLRASCPGGCGRKPAHESSARSVRRNLWSLVLRGAHRLRCRV